MIEAIISTPTIAMVLLALTLYFSGGDGGV